MKTINVEIGGCYLAKITNKLTTVKILSKATYGGWLARNLKTGREVHIKSAKKLRKRVTGFPPFGRE